MKLRVEVAAVLGILAGVLPAACGGKGGSGASTSASNSAQASSSGGGNTGTGGSTTSTTSTTGGGGNTPNDLCVRTGHEGECEMCCASDNAGGYNTYVGALILDCACTTGAPCYTQCSDPMDLCDNQAAMTGSSTCIDCLNAVPKTNACYTATTNSVTAACNADPSCVAFTTCEMGCKGLPM